MQRRTVTARVPGGGNADFIPRRIRVEFSEGLGVQSDLALMIIVSTGFAVLFSTHILFASHDSRRIVLRGFVGNSHDKQEKFGF